MTLTSFSDLDGHLDSVTSACISPDSKIVITASCNADFRVWETDTYKCIFVKENVHDGGIQSCDFSGNLEPIPNVFYDGQIYLLATCGNDSMVKIWKISIDVVG